MALTWKVQHSNTTEERTYVNTHHIRFWVLCKKKNKYKCHSHGKKIHMQTYIFTYDLLSVGKSYGSSRSITGLPPTHCDIITTSCATIHGHTSIKYSTRPALLSQTPCTHCTLTLDTTATPALQRFQTADRNYVYNKYNGNEVSQFTTYPHPAWYWTVYGMSVKWSPSIRTPCSANTSILFCVAVQCLNYGQ